MKIKTKNKKKGLRHHIKKVHHHVKKHLKNLKKKRPHLHKTLVLMSITAPIILGAVLFGSSALYYYESFVGLKDYDDSQEKITVNIPAVPDDTASWKTYNDQTIGFSIKYSDSWPNPKIEKASGGSKFLQKLTFSNGLDNKNSQYQGFEVFIYDSKKFSGPVGTDNLKLKDSAISPDDCGKAEFGEATFGEESYPGQEVDIDSTDKCFEKTYFFSLTRGGYTFNILPETAQGTNPISEESKADIIAAFPKFFEILSTIVVKEKKEEIADGEKPIVKKATPPRRVLAPLGRCPHKNDHPRKSRTKKHRHMDEDCCMDPDEWPNPRCQY